jgi:iron complex outermembrane receptor protein
MRMIKRLLSASATLAWLSCAAPVFAQNGAESDDTIIVTAQKRVQSLIDVPQSVSVVSGDALERQQATSFRDYLKLAPGLQLNGGSTGQGRLTLRGINTGGGGATVSTYVDETPYGSSTSLSDGGSYAADVDTLDIARVEVLRGPQGTLYGATSLGGVVKFVTERPDIARFAARARATVETTDGGDISHALAGVVNVPIADTLAVRASGYHRRTGGYIDSIGTAGSDLQKNINDSTSYGGRISALFAPSEALSIRLTAVLQNIRNDADNVVEASPVDLSILYGRPSNSQFVPAYRNLSYRIYNATVDLDLGFADLLSSTSYSRLDVDNRQELTPQYGGLIKGAFGVPADVYADNLTNQRKFTQEIRLSSQDNDRFEWLVGGYFTRETGKLDQLYVAATPGTVTAVPGLPLLVKADLSSIYREYAGFANATLHLGERFDLTFGGRYSRNEQSAVQTLQGGLVGGLVGYPEKRSSQNVFTWSVAPKFKINDHVSVYARASKGYRPGGPNVLAPGTPAGIPTQYRADTLVSYEAGVKAETADRTFGIDLAAFHLEWSDIQLFARVNGVGLTANGGRAESDGFEFTSTFRPARGLDLTINGAYTRARLTDDTDPVVGGRVGDLLPYTPEFSIGADGQYEWSVGTDATAYLGGSLRFLSKQPADFEAGYTQATGRQRTLPSYEIVDLRAGVRFDRVSIEAFARNIGNSRGIVDAGGIGMYANGAIGTALVRPRTIGLTLGAEF